MTDDNDKTSESQSSRRHLRGKGGVVLAVVGLLLVGGVAILAAPSHGNQPSQGLSSGTATTAAPTLVADSTGTPLGTATATDSPPPTPPGPATPPSPHQTPMPPPPTPTPLPTQTPTPTWHIVGSWRGSSAGTAGKATLGNNNPVRLVYTCAATTPAWNMQIGFMSDAGAGGSTANTTCDGASHTLDLGPFHDNPGGNGTCTFTVSAEYGTQTVSAWTLTVEVWY